MIELSNGIILTWMVADGEARAAGASVLEPAHLLIALCKLCDLPLEEILQGNLPEAGRVLPELEAEVDELRNAFEAGRVDQTHFRRRLRSLIAAYPHPINEGEHIHRSKNARRAFARAETSALERNDRVRPIHLLAALLETDDPPWRRLFSEMDVSEAGFREVVRERQTLENPALQGNRNLSDPPVPPRPRGSPDKKSSFLSVFGRDLTKLAHAGKLDPVIGRRTEMRALARILVQKRKNSAILIGEAGVGKTGILEGLALRIAEPTPPRGLEHKRIIEVSVASLVAGTKYRGEFEQRMQAFIEEASADENVILFIDEIHTIMGAGGDGSSDAANILKPALARGGLRCIAATTIAEYRRYIEKDSAFERRFETVWVEEPSVSEALEILKGIRSRFEHHHGLHISDEALETAVELSARYLTDSYLPDKAIDLVDQACALARMASLSVRPDVPSSVSLGRVEIANVVAQRCRIPLEQLTADEAERLLHMEDTLAKRVMGQQEAIWEVSETVRTARAGLKDPKRPVATFLFVGSTGTGKTELAKALAEFLFADKCRLIRCDMSEFIEQHSVAKLIGAPPGYIGHDEEGQLTRAVRSSPYSVVLFDEIEKAHPRVLDLFLQILDEGQLTDSKGRRVSFRETIIIMTSNLGTEAVGEREHSFGFPTPATSSSERSLLDSQDYRESLLAAIHGSLRPELVNRIDRCVLFRSLSPEVVRNIIDKILADVRARIRSQEMGLSLSDAVYDLLMNQGYDPTFGAREMARTVNRVIVQPLGKALLEKRFQAGASIHVVSANGGVVFESR